MPIRLVSIWCLAICVTAGCEMTGNAPKAGSGPMVVSPPSTKMNDRSEPVFAGVNETNFEKIRYGMRVEEVEAILGRSADGSGRPGGSLSVEINSFWSGPQGKAFITFNRDQYERMVVTDLRFDKNLIP